LIALVLATRPATALDPHTKITDLVHTKWSGGDIPFSEVRDLAQTKDGTLWLATRQGLFHFDGVRFTRLEALSRTEIRRILATRDGSLWVVFGSGRVSRLCGGNITTFSLQELPQTNALAEDRDGSLVAATANGGLARLRDGRWHETAREFDPAVANPGYRPHVERYGALGGIPGVIELKAGSRDRLWVATSEGLEHLNLDPHASRNPLPPPVQIQTVTADGKTMAASQRIALPKLTHNLQIDYSAFSLTIPERAQFRYKLEGVDKDWQETARRQVCYTDLALKKYRLLVKACNNNGVWNEERAALDFSGDPAYYRTRWFQAACVAAFLPLFWGLYRLRLRQIARQFNARLEERSQNVSSDTTTIRVLAADDHTLLREGIAALVNAQTDMELVAHASTGREAIEQFRMPQPDITSSDLIRLSRRPGLLLCLCLVGGGAASVCADDHAAAHNAGSKVRINPQAVRLPIVDAVDNRFVRLSTAQGVSQIKVDQIVQDDDGFM